MNIFEIVDHCIHYNYPNLRIPEKLRNYLNEIRGGFYRNYNSESRNVSDIVSHTYFRWVNQVNPYMLLENLLQLISPNKPFQAFRFFYKTVSQTDTLPSALEFINSHALEADANFTATHIVYIPRGYVFIKRLFENDETIKEYELSAISESITKDTPPTVAPLSLFKIYRTPGHHPVIFVNSLSDYYFNELWLHLPSLYNPQIPDNLEESKEYIIKCIDMLTTDVVIPNETPVKDLVLNFISTLNNTLSLLEKSLKIEIQGLNDFATRLANNTTTSLKENLQSNIDTINRRIADYETSLTNFYNDKSKFITQLQAIQNVEIRPPKEVINVISAQQNIEILSANSNTLALRITAPLKYFRSEDFACYENALSANRDTPLKRFTPAQRAVLHKIFITKEYSLILQSIITLRISGGGSISLDSYSGTYTETANPHIKYYNCWGKAKTETINYLCKQDYELAFAQIVAAIQTVNLAEEPTFVRHTLNDDITKHDPVCHIKNNNTGEVKTFREWTEIAHKEIEKEIEEAKKAKSETPETPETPATGPSQVTVTDETPTILVSHETIPGAYTQVVIEEETI